MKKILLIVLPLLFIMSCEEDKDVSAFVGTWDLTFLGEYENSNCTGSLDSLIWAFAQAFEFEVSISIDEDETFEMSTSSINSDTTETGTWSESSDGSLITEGGSISDGEGVLSADGNSFSITSMEDAHCEDSNFEETSHTDSTSCQDAGNDWYEANCTLFVFTKQ